ncbi:DUF4123 domain-containing protein [Paracoccus sp. S1E-3]|uniref:DUF4123 domain-containing protein n=1 Tax=Paracoccus sp. S1E-3 TaxID=2756130 RepID=UPI0015EEEF40|nr:DUF4123 domain-containing protein [Paracoccus sp. S1E-3]MBA4490447.1 DUF4123 domain-containing protein [Paracoccus sp. S1E-3]
MNAEDWYTAEESGGDLPKFTYAVLDAAKVPHLIEVLEVSNLRHECLFLNDTGESLKDVAPLLVGIEAQSGLTRRLFTGEEGLGGLWHRECGIFLRTSATFEQMWRYFRKFTRIQDETG